MWAALYLINYIVWVYLHYNWEDTSLHCKWKNNIIEQILLLLGEKLIVSDCFMPVRRTCRQVTSQLLRCYTSDNVV